LVSEKADLSKSHQKNGRLESPVYLKMKNETTKPNHDRCTEAYLSTDEPPASETLRLIESLSRRVITILPDAKPTGKPPWDLANRD
jgi:hypothetical protein